MTLDSLGALPALEGLPEQLGTASDAATEALAGARFPEAGSVTSVVVAGMGGSGIAGDIAAAVGAETIPVPVLVLKGDRVPAFVGPGSLVLAVSYSGDTEETLATARAALGAGAWLVTVSAGGALEKLSAEHGGPHVPCLSGIPMPRFALGALVAPVLLTLERLGLLPDTSAALTAARAQLARRRDRCAPHVAPPANPAREIARQIGRTVPLVYGAGALGAVAAMRWKASVNENAKAPAFWNVFPELDHNEVASWGQHGDVTRQLVTLVELRHGLEDDRMATRMGLTRDLVEEAVAQVLRVDAEGEGPLARLLDLCYVGDWASCYLALDNDVDPGPIDVIAQLKAKLGPGA